MAASEKKAFGLSFLDAHEDDTPLPPPRPPPPCLEVLPSEASSSVECTVETVNLGEFTLLKGRVSTKEVFGLPNSDLVPGVYEGGLKLWEGSLDLVKALHYDVQNGNLLFKGKRVLELGCGHGLPGIFSCLEGAAVVHFQDFNAEVLRCLTILNANTNLSKNLQPTVTNETDFHTEAEVRYFAGDWSQIHQLLPSVNCNEKDMNCQSGQSPTSGYDIILMAETVYSISTHQSLYELIKKCISRPHGVVYLAAKKHYFGVGGGTRRFLSMVENDGSMNACLVSEVADGSSNVREVWKLLVRLRNWTMMCPVKVWHTDKPIISAQLIGSLSLKPNYEHGYSRIVTASIILKPALLGTSRYSISDKFGPKLRKSRHKFAKSKYRSWFKY